MSIANAMSIEFEHQLRFEPKIVNGTATHTTDHGFCICGWEAWSPNGKLEVRELHEQHREFERRKAAEQLQHLKNIEANKHQAQWNATGDFLACSYCNWSFQSSNTAKAIVAWNEHKHKESIKDAIE